MKNWIDLRSDTVTRPSASMRRAMSNAPVGDDVYSEDPSVNQLEEITAELVAMEAAIFCPSGTQSNLLALLCHCQRGDEYIVGQQAHTYRYEGGGAAVLGSIQPQPLEFESDGTLDLDKVAATIKADDFHFAKTRLLALENTLGGQVIPQSYIRSASRFARQRGLAIHLDGARVCNAAIAQGIRVDQITENFDSVSICFSKGLGAPVGSALCGSLDFIKRARRWRKMLGGGMRQAGILAAAAIHALENNLTQLAVDHENARLLAKGLKRLERLRVKYDDASTNMVFVGLPQSDVAALIDYADHRGLKLASGNPMRLVLHRDIEQQDVETIISILSDYFQNH